MPRSTINGTAIDLDGKEMILDADQDTTLTVDTDDQVDIKVAGSDVVSVTGSNNTFSNSNITLNSGSNIPTVTFQESASAKYYIGESANVGGGGAGFYDHYAVAGKGLRFFTAAAEVMKADTNGHITMPKQSAFSATNNTGQNNLAINSSVTVLYQSEIFDQNADYNTSSSVFTAPVTGRYWFQASVIFGSPQTDATYIEFAIDTSNRNYSLALNDYDAFDSVTTYWAINGSCFADMDSGDTANVRIYQAAGTAATDIYHSVEGARFSGYLVC